MRPVCAHFFNDLVLLYIRRVHGRAAGRTFYEPVRPDGAHNKTLISNTDLYCVLHAKKKEGGGEGGPDGM